MNPAFHNSEGLSEIGFFEGDQTRYWLSGFGENDLLTGSGFLHQAGEVGLSGVYIYSFHRLN
jgi:hypothetical protein